MGALKMDSESLRSLGNGIKGNSGSFGALVSKFQGEYETITANGTWDGPDSTTFAQAASNFKADLDKAVQLVDEVGQNLVDTANNYDTIHESVSSSISGMLG